MNIKLLDVELNDIYQDMAENARLASGSEYAQDIAHAIMLLARKIDELKQEHSRCLVGRQTPWNTRLHQYMTPYERECHCGHAETMHRYRVIVSNMFDQPCTLCDCPHFTHRSIYR